MQLEKFIKSRTDHPSSFQQKFNRGSHDPGVRGIPLDLLLPQQFNDRAHDLLILWYIGAEVIKQSMNLLKLLEIGGNLHVIYTSQLFQMR